MSEDNVLNEKTIKYPAYEDMSKFEISDNPYRKPFGYLSIKEIKIGDSFLTIDGLKINNKYSNNFIKVFYSQYNKKLLLFTIYLITSKLLLPILSFIIPLILVLYFTDSIDMISNLLKKYEKLITPLILVVILCIVIPYFKKNIIPLFVIGKSLAKSEVLINLSEEVSTAVYYDDMDHIIFDNDKLIFKQKGNYEKNELIMPIEYVDYVKNVISKKYTLCNCGQILRDDYLFCPYCGHQQER